MTNRIIDFLREPEEEEEKAAEEFFCLSGDFGWYYVSRETAEKLIALLERKWKPRWLRFQDLFGSSVRVLARDVTQVEECTLESRKRQRAFQRARKREKNADRKWEDE